MTEQDRDQVDLQFVEDISLDGYITGPRDGVDAPMGINGFRLFNWLDRRNDPGPSGQVFTELMATRAVISGRRTYEHAGRWQGDHHDGVPNFVLTSDVPDDPPPGIVRYVTDVLECASRARAAAGDGEVIARGRAGAGAAAGRAARRDGTARRTGPARAGATAVRRPAGSARRARAGPLLDHSGGRRTRTAGHTPALPRTPTVTLDRSISATFRANPRPQAQGVALVIQSAAPSVPRWCGLRDTERRGGLCLCRAG